MKEKTTRRNVVKAMVCSAATMGAGLTAFSATAKTPDENMKKQGDVIMHQDVPLFSSAKKHGNLVYLAGKGAHFEGDIKAHTKHVLDELEKELKKSGSSMEKVLKVNIYLADLNDYKSMNEVYRGRFGDSPPVRTTVATYGGVPGNSLVEIDCIAALD